MKKLLFLLFALSLFSCSKDPDLTQDYTSFIFYHSENITLPNCVAGYYDKDGFCIKIAELGDLSQNQRSPEITVENNSVKEVFLFSDYRSPLSRATKTDSTFILNFNHKNIFKIESWVKGIEVEKNNPKQYPH